MLGYSTAKAAIDYLLGTGIVSKVYHDVFLVEKKDEVGTKYPVYSEGTEFVYVGINDSKIMNCYFRPLNPAELVRSEFVGSSKKIHKARVRYRVVFFNDNEERNFDSLIQNILRMSLFQNIDFASLITDSEALIIQEANRPLSFHANTFYVALDINVNFWTFYDDCNTPLDCEVLPNPICVI